MSLLDTSCNHTKGNVNVSNSSKGDQSFHWQPRIVSERKSKDDDVSENKQERTKKTENNIKTDKGYQENGQINLNLPFNSFSLSRIIFVDVESCRPSAHLNSPSFLHSNFDIDDKSPSWGSKSPSFDIRRTTILRIYIFFISVLLFANRAYS